MELVRVLVTAASQVSRLVVHAREQRIRDPGYRARHVVARELTAAMKTVHSGNPLVLVQEFIKSRHVHDRTIDIALMDADGCEVEYRYDLTGGIDFLLNPAKPTSRVTPTPRVVHTVVGLSPTPAPSPADVTKKTSVIVLLSLPACRARRALPEWPFARRRLRLTPYTHWYRSRPPGKSLKTVKAYADLEIGIHRRDAGRYGVDLGRRS